MIYGNRLYNINNTCGADYLLFGVAAMARRRFSDERRLVGVEMGTAYGGGVEGIGKIWKGIGDIHAFDTFEGHPDFLADDPNSHEATCMRRWYSNQHAGKWRIPELTREMLSIEYQRKVLDDQGLSNVFLHKGLIDESSLNGINDIHYCLLDMDLVSSMRLGFSLVKDKIVPGGFLALHDCTPKNHIPGLWELYKEILGSNKWKEIMHCKRRFCGKTS